LLTVSAEQASDWRLTISMFWFAATKVLNGSSKVVGMAVVSNWTKAERLHTALF